MGKPGSSHTPRSHIVQGRAGFLSDSHSPPTPWSCLVHLHLPEYGHSPGCEQARPPHGGPGTTELTRASRICVMNSRGEWRPCAQHWAKEKTGHPASSNRTVGRHSWCSLPKGLLPERVPFFYRQVQWGFLLLDFPAHSQLAKYTESTWGG